MRKKRIALTTRMSFLISRASKMIWCSKTRQKPAKIWPQVSWVSIWTAKISLSKNCRDFWITKLNYKCHLQKSTSSESLFSPICKFCFIDTKQTVKRLSQVGWKASPKELKEAFLFYTIPEMYEMYCSTSSAIWSVKCTSFSTTQRTNDIFCTQNVEKRANPETLISIKYFLGALNTVHLTWSGDCICRRSLNIWFNIYDNMSQCLPDIVQVT